MSSNQKYGLIKWDTPFAEVKYPSVWVIGDEKEDSRNLLVAVAPDGIDKYPKYLIHFENVLAFKSEEESQWAQKSEKKLTIDPNSKSSFIRLKDSFWWNAYGGQMRDFYSAEPMHYYLFGGDNLVEVFASNKTRIEKVETAKTVNLKHVV